MDVDVSLDYGLTLFAALLIGLGFVLQQNAAQAEPDSRFLSVHLILDLARTPRWLAGIASMIAGQVLAAWSIGHLSLGFVEPLLTTNLVFALVLAVPIAKAKLRFWEIFGAAVLCTGVALLSASRSAKPIGLSVGSFSHWPAAALIAGIAFLAVQAGRRHPGRRRAMLTGTAAGLVFGIQDALTRQTLEILQSNGAGAMFTTWAPYALVGAGAIGIWLMQCAFSAGPLPQSLPAISAGEPLVGMLLGVLVFGDRIQITPGELALQAAGIAALIAGMIIVGRAPALSQLRAWTPPSLPHVPQLPHVPHVPALPHLPALPHVPRNLATLPGRHAKHPAKHLAKPLRPRAGDVGHPNGDNPAPPDPATTPTDPTAATTASPTPAPTRAAPNPASATAAPNPAAAPHLSADPGSTTLPREAGYPSADTRPGDAGLLLGEAGLLPGDASLSGGNGFSGNPGSQREPTPSGEPADTTRPDALALPAPASRRLPGSLAASNHCGPCAANTAANGPQCSKTAISAMDKRCKTGHMTGFAGRFPQLAHDNRLPRGFAGTGEATSSGHSRACVNEPLRAQRLRRPASKLSRNLFLLRSRSI